MYSISISISITRFVRRRARPHVWKIYGRVHIIKEADQPADRTTASRSTNHRQDTQSQQPTHASRQKQASKQARQAQKTRKEIGSHVEVEVTVSIPALASITPVTPPKVNRKTKPIEKSIGVSKVNEPPHIVAIQLNIFIPVGTAIMIVANIK